MSKSQLQERTRETIRNDVLSLVSNIFIYYQHPKEGFEKIILSPRAEETLRDIIERKIPTILLGPHLGNYDLFGMSLAWLGLRPYVLSYPNPNNAYKAQNRMREAVGMNVHPIPFHPFGRQEKL